jgi:hypothetical protein
MDAGSLDRLGQRRPHRPDLFAALIVLESFAVFLGLHLPQLVDFYRRIPASTHVMSWELGSMPRWIAMNSAEALFAFAAVVIPGVLLAQSGVTRWYWVPATLFFFVPGHLGLQPGPIAVLGQPWIANDWALAIVQLGIILAPAYVIAHRRPRCDSDLHMEPRLAAVAIAISAIAILRYGMWLEGSDLWWQGALVVTSMALLWDVRSAKRALVVFAVATLYSSVPEMLLLIVLPGWHGTPSESLRASGGDPMYLIAAIAAAATPLAVLLSTMPMHRQHAPQPTV